ncbi:MAG: hypothetical protein IJW23_10530 [Lentisphaeria bacterium]|nr:hypothetical protein [Lentisphaeria bacterium]
MKKIYGLCAVLAIAMLTGCSTERLAPVDTSTGMSSLQQRVLTTRNIGSEFNATYNDVWYATIATLQMNGFVLRHADKHSGFIYGVWQNTYERQYEQSAGALTLTQIGSGWSTSVGSFFGKTEVYKQIEVSVTLEPLATTQTLVRLSSRFDSAGTPTAEGVFANRFFGQLRREVFLRVNNGSIYQPFAVNNSK